MVDQSRIDAIQDRLDRATPGTWTAHRHHGGTLTDIIADSTDDFGEVLEDAKLLNDADRKFITSAPDDIAYLLGVIDNLERS